MEAIYKHIGIVLRLARESRQQTQEGVAARSGVSQSQLARWEAGKSRIQVHDLIRLAGALGMKPAKFWRLFESILDIDK